MDRLQATQLKEALAEVERLRALHHSNGDLRAWTDKVKKLLAAAYGNDSPEMRRFESAPGKSFIVRTETGLTEEYHRKLDCYEAVLGGLIEKG